MMKMAREYLPKLIIAILALSVAVAIIAAQPTQVAASSSPQGTSYSSYSYSYSPSYYGYHYRWRNYWGGYPYYSSYYYSYYPYYSYYYPYYSSYYYPYYSSYYCPSSSYSYPNYYGYPYYYSGYYSGYSSSYCTPTSYTLSMNTDPSNLGTVNGAGSYTSGSSASFSVTQTTIQVSSDTRYVFDHWSGDYTGAGTSGTVTMNNAMSITAVYKTQYYLTVNAQPQNAPAAQGAGWYNSGDTATVQNGGQTIGDSQSRLVFQGWSVDGQASQPSSTLSVVMNAPHSVTALYGQQYYLNVQTDQGVASGSGWYDAGSTAQISVSTPISTQYGVSIIFNGWQGDTTSTSQSTSIVMDGPKNVVATWRTDSTVLYLTIAAVIVAAVLIVAGLIAFIARGRGGRQAPPPQPPAAAAPRNNVQQRQSYTEPTTLQGNEQPREPNSTP